MQALLDSPESLASVLPDGVPANVDPIFIGSLMRIVTSVDSSISSLDDFKNRLPLVTNALLSSYSFSDVSSDITEIRGIALSSIEAAGGNILSAGNELENRAAQDRILIISGLNSLKGLGTEISIDLSQLLQEIPPAISEKISGVDLNSFLNTDNISLDGLREYINTEIDDTERSIDDVEIVTLGKQIVTDQVNTLIGEETVDTTEFLSYVRDVSSVDNPNSMGDTYQCGTNTDPGKPAGYNITQAIQWESLLFNGDGVFSGLGDNQITCGDGFTRSSTTVPPTLNCDSGTISYTGCETNPIVAQIDQKSCTKPTGASILYENLPPTAEFYSGAYTTPDGTDAPSCAGEALGTPVLTCPGSSTEYTFTGCETNPTAQIDQKSCTKPTGASILYENLPPTAEFYSGAYTTPDGTDAPSCAGEALGTPVLTCPGSSTEYTFTGCASQPTAGTCEAVYGQGGTDICSQKASYSGIWNAINLPYDHNDMLPSAIYDPNKPGNITKACDEDCSDPTKYEGINECCTLDSPSENFCTLFKNITNASAGAQNCQANDNYAGCPPTWDEYWAQDTYWNEYFWIISNCGGEVAPDTSTDTSADN